MNHLTRNRTIIPPDQLATIFELRNEGITLANIAAHMGYYVSTVRDACELAEYCGLGMYNKMYLEKWRKSNET